MVKFLDGYILGTTDYCIEMFKDAFIWGGGVQGVKPRPLKTKEKEKREKNGGF